MPAGAPRTKRLGYDWDILVSDNKKGKAKMKNKSNLTALRRRLMTTISRTAPCMAGAGALLLAAGAHQAKALNLYDGTQVGNNLEVNLTTTVSYSTFYRVNSPSAILTSPTGNANGSEGDLAFQHGFFSNQAEILPVFDVRDGNFGLHASGEAYINTVYLQKNGNDQPATFNPFSAPVNNDFTSATRNVNGLQAKLLTAFAYASHTFDNDQSISLKVGRSTLFWGQSLLLYSDAIAGGQAPVDIITAQTTPNAQAQQVFLPVGQAVLTYQPFPAYGVTLQAYYQFEELHDNFQGVGAYFNSSDILDKGGERLILGPGAYAFRTNDLNPPAQNGQFGVSIQAPFHNVDLGLYALRFDSKTPQVYLYPGNGFGNTPHGFQVGTYTLVYPRDIGIIGTSFSTNVGPTNVAGELSGRINQPLVGGLGIQSAANPGNASSDPLYPVGNTIQGQVSAIYLTPAVPLVPGGINFTGEVEMNHLLQTTKNRAALAPGRQATAGVANVVISPAYNNLLPRLNVTVPIGIGYNFLGRSQMDSTINHGTGYFNIGVQGVYNTVWTASIVYYDYLGKADTVTNGLADRGYLEFNVQRTF
jgi:hypothetical protein